MNKPLAISIFLISQKIPLSLQERMEIYTFMNKYKKEPENETINKNKAKKATNISNIRR